jgi:hypothetical protein
LPRSDGHRPDAEDDPSPVGAPGDGATDMDLVLPATGTADKAHLLPSVFDKHPVKNSPVQ